MSDTLNVLHVVERIDDRYGGPARSIPYTALHARAPGIDHRIYSCRYDVRDRNSVCENFGLAYKQFAYLGPKKIAFSPRLCGAIYRFVRDMDNPIVHVHNAWNFVPFWVWFLRLFTKFRIIVSVRGSLFPWSLEQGKTRKRLAWILFQKRLLLRADMVHVTSEDERDQVCRLGVCDNLELIPNGVHVDSPNPIGQLTPRNYEPGAQLRLLFVSRIHPKKGVDILFSALSNSAIDFAVELVVAGDFSDEAYRTKIEAMVSALCEKISVSFLGHVDGIRLAELYENADLFVLPSHTENFGIAIAEALSHGLPVITTIHTPWLEVKTQGAGYIIDTDEDALVEALCDFYGKSIGARVMMSHNARELVAKYDWRRLGPIYADMYERLT